MWPCSGPWAGERESQFVEPTAESPRDPRLSGKTFPPGPDQTGDRFCPDTVLAENTESVEGAGSSSPSPPALPVPPVRFEGGDRLPSPHYLSFLALWGRTLTLPESSRCKPTPGSASQATVQADAGTGREAAAAHPNVVGDSSESCPTMSVTFIPM